METARNSKIKKARKSGFRAKSRTSGGRAALNRQRRLRHKGKVKNISKIAKARA